MKKDEFAKLKSVINFKNNVKRTQDFIRSIEANITVTNELIEFLKAREKAGYNKFKKEIEFDEDKFSYLYEVGYIALFSNFEFFVFDLLKELFLRYPKNLNGESMEYDEIKNLKTLKKIKECLADALAIKKSFNTEDACGYLEINFGIHLIKNKEQFELLNALRNVFMHGGAITNSKFRKDIKKYVKAEVPLNEKITLDRKKFYYVLSKIFSEIIK